jgi:hypothetical protein
MEDERGLQQMVETQWVGKKGRGMNGMGSGRWVVDAM